MNGRNDRRSAILRLVQTRVVHSMDELHALLSDEGITADRASLARETKELGLVKMPMRDANGSLFSKFVLPGEPARYLSQLHRIVSELVDAVKASETMVIVKTPPGSAGMVAAEIDRAAWPEALGTLAGDDTVFIACAGKAQTARLVQRLDEMKAGHAS